MEHIDKKNTPSHPDRDRPEKGQSDKLNESKIPDFHFIPPPPPPPKKSKDSKETKES